jgi:hypothetical protein
MIWDFFLIDETWLRQRKWSPVTNTWEPGPFDLGRRLPYRGPLRWRRVEPAWSPRDYVSQVLKDLGGDRIRTLSLHGHGNAGLVQLGRPTDYLNLRNAGELEPLRDCFAREAGVRPRVEICGCYLANDTPVDLDAAFDRYQMCSRGGWTNSACVGLQENPIPHGTFDIRRPKGLGDGVLMLQALAEVLQVPVRASIDYLPNQFPPTFSLPKSDRVIEVWPPGSGGLLRHMVSDSKAAQKAAAEETREVDRGIDELMRRKGP